MDLRFLSVIEEKAELLRQLQSLGNCLDTTEEDAFLEGAAMCDEALLEQFLETGTLEPWEGTILRCRT